MSKKSAAKTKTNTKNETCCNFSPLLPAVGIVAKHFYFVFLLLLLPAVPFDNYFRLHRRGASIVVALLTAFACALVCNLICDAHVHTHLHTYIVTYLHIHTSIYMYVRIHCVFAACNMEFSVPLIIIILFFIFVLFCARLWVSCFWFSALILFWSHIYLVAFLALTYYRLYNFG